MIKECFRDQTFLNYLMLDHIILIPFVSFVVFVVVVVITVFAAMCFMMICQLIK